MFEGISNKGEKTYIKLNLSNEDLTLSCVIIKIQFQFQSSVRFVIEMCNFDGKHVQKIYMFV